MSDLISRQAAINAIGKLSDEIYRTVEKGATFPTEEWFDGMAQAEHIVKNLPSAQPEIIRCKECKHASYEPCEGHEDVYVCNRTVCTRLSGGNMPDHYCGYAERGEKANEGNH